MKGVYILKIYLRESMEIKVGAMGSLLFRKGFYAYTGSAMGGLEKRISRHLRKEKKLHWHIDYLLQRAEIKEVHIKETVSKQDECRTAAALEQHGGTPIIKFGSSDCSCKSHLFHFKNFSKLPVSNYRLTNT